MSNYSDNHFTNSPNHVWTKVYNLIGGHTSVLDVGCSSGRFGEALIKLKGCTVDGIEMDPSDYKEAKLRLQRAYIGNIENFDIKAIGDKYDYVVFSDVIEHLVDPISTLKKTKKLLEPGGRIIFSIPNMAHISVRLMLLGGNFDYGKTGLLDNTHLHFYTKKEILRIFHEAGYEIRRLDYTEIDYNDEVISSELKSLGLNSTKETKNLLNGIDAVAFQYVGSASPTKKKINANLPIASPDPEGLYTKHYADKEKHYAARTALLEQRILELEHEINLSKMQQRRPGALLRTIKKTIKNKSKA